MSYIMTGAELAAKAIDCAANHKTLYVNGCWGAPMTDANKQRWLKNSYNSRDDRKAKIEAATADTFGFDCICFIKGLLWGWNGDASKVYGGASYGSNGVEDMTLEKMLAKCEDASEDFSTVQVGEYLYMEGHCGIYIGDGMAAECVSRWEDGVQKTRIWNMRSNNGTPGRYWQKHGKLPWISYESEPVYRVTIENVDKSRAAELVTEGAEKGWAVNVEAMTVADTPAEVPVQPAPEADAGAEEETVTVDYAKSKDAAKAGSYRVNVNEFLNMRSGAGLDKPIIKKLQPGDIVKCYGFYTDAWLCVAAPDGTVGYCHQGYLDKV